MKLDSVEKWDLEAQRKFWNEWDERHLRETSLGDEASRRGRVALALLEECKLQNPRILELGCGNGWLAEKLAGFGKVTGVDLADVAILEARRRLPAAAFCAGDVFELDLPSAYYDVIVSLEMFSHVSRQKLFIERIANLLTEQGLLILTSQNRTVYTRRKDILPPAPGQLRHWVTMKELRHMLAAQFDVQRAFTIQPSGNKGFLRVVNSPRVNAVLQRFIRVETLNRFKEGCGLGQTLIVLARKHMSRVDIQS